MSRTEDQLGSFQGAGLIKTVPDNLAYSAGVAVATTMLLKSSAATSIEESITGTFNIGSNVYVLRPTELAILSGESKGYIELETDPFDFGVQQQKHLVGVMVEYKNMFNVAVEVLRRYHPSLEFEPAGRVMLGKEPLIRCFIFGQEFKLVITGEAIIRDTALIGKVAVFWKPSDKRGIYGNTYGTSQQPD